MKLSILLLFSCVFLVSGYIVQHDNKVYKYADKDFLFKQKFFLDIFRNMHSDLQYPEYLKDAELVEGENNYNNYFYVKDFFKYYKFGGMLKRGEIFSVMNKMHRDEMKHIFNLFYYSKDWTTFYKNCIWARIHMNEEMFVYAVTAAVLHRNDFTGIVLPPLHEICPYKFFYGEILNDAVQHKLHHVGYTNDYIYYTTNATHNFYKMNDEQKLSYFTEDIGLNAYYYYFNMDYPFWLGGKDFNLYQDRRGEQYLYFHQQLLARYYMERLTNGLGDIEKLNWHEPINTGYFSGLKYYNGINYPVRDNYYRVTPTKHYYLLDMVLDYERRIRDVIDSGHLVMEDKTIIDLYDSKGVDYLGNLIQGNPDNVNNKFYGYVMVFSRLILGGSYFDNYNNYLVLPSVLEHYETSMRDPVFYQLYKRFIHYYWTYKDHFDAYTQDELNVKEVKIDNVNVGNLLTYFEDFDSDITNAIDMDWSSKMYYNYDNSHADKTTQDKFFDHGGKYRTIGSKIREHKFDSTYANEKDYHNQGNKWGHGDNTQDKYGHNIGAEYHNKDDYQKQFAFESNFKKDNEGKRWDQYYNGGEYYNKDDSENQYSYLHSGYKNAVNYNYNENKYNYNFMYKTTQQRLNHLPFFFNLDVTSTRAMKVVVRAYMGPKYDQFGHVIDLHTNRKNFVEFDKFYYDITEGKTSIKRNSKEFYYSVRDRTTYSELYKYVMSAIDGKTKFQLDMSEAHCGFPDRLILPKGKVGGYHMQFFFIITEFKDKVDKQGTKYDYTYSCGVGSGNRYFDDLPFGYPFDRKIDEYKFQTNNMYFKDVVVYHKSSDSFRNYIPSV